ncbi:class I SAM-dependent methyltransferase [Sporosarcina gallistercoris]|uniref:Class I SAM-dependent methyltransferase n=1 Tax=Sporosarcina gallistercoris TaxID=2762245 RepID=A0ABR8PK48_9BACL|nr:class I SAM-dependent methyltransferase [Sporosarcina gallistercoris]MBD7908561.1 class I SAM-dependent methyltransferase [Sporosarcina gallistercoris]
MGSLFSRVYDAAMQPLEATRFKQVRTELIGKAKGRVLEIGSGTGINFPYYKNAIRVDAIEPNPSMSKRAGDRLRNARVQIQVHETGAEALPFDNDTFDTVVATLVFCTIPYPIKALAEIQRVSKPGAVLLFFEHVRMEPFLLSKSQDLLNPLWEKVCDGCQLNRETLTLIKESGIEVTKVKAYYAKLFLYIEGLNMEK